MLFSFLLNHHTIRRVVPGGYRDASMVLRIIHHLTKLVGYFTVFLLESFYTVIFCGFGRFEVVMVFSFVALETSKRKKLMLVVGD